MALVQTDPIEGIFDPLQVRPAYQPIVDLVTGDVVGAEALARWPGLSITPDVAFEYARRQGRVEQLDSLCQQAAVEVAAAVELPHGFKVFVNVEPGMSVDAITERPSGPEVIAEITERALLDHPAELLQALRQMRARGCGIALDDVGAVPDSLALLPFVAPDVIKLDVSLVRGWPNADQARILTAVSSYAERSGATVFAEGIETEAQLGQALALGATLGQGWYFSRPGPLGAYPPMRRPVAVRPPPTPTMGTPFELIDQTTSRVGPKGLLLQISRHIEQQGAALQTPPVVLGAFQEARRFTADTARRYRDLSTRCPLVVALGAGMGASPAPGVRGASLALDDPLRGEWTVVVVGVNYTGALIARDLGDMGPDLGRRYMFTLTHDRATVLKAARSLLRRVDSEKAAQS